MPADYHLHTPLCRHATGTPTELAAQAVRAGLTEIGFSDHNPMPQDDFDDWRMRRAELDSYFEQVEQARRTYPDLVIKMALEVDYLPGYEQWVRELAATYPWDYFIGSVHYISSDWAIDNPKQLSEWKKHDPMEVWTVYFQRLTAAAESGLFDIIGHADLCKKFCVYPAEDWMPLAGRFLEAAKQHGVAIELNTAGLRKDCKEIYPSQRIVHLAAQLGVPITFGSDAHAPQEVGLNLAEAVQLARAAGYTHSCRFTRRKRELVAL
ncbi:MAG TPA: histidinol-phosphatase HisJ [Verrucomicrobiae bacterium]|nr:histidinol-phosphatase HisJ [Verrucomicrobiae bacterium]